MPAYNPEHETMRLAEPGLSYDARVKSAYDNLRTLTYERTEMPSPFRLRATEGAVTAIGYEHRGDLSKSFNKSVEEANSDQVEIRYALENLGFEEAKKEFSTLPPYSTVVLFSPAPDIPIKGYPGHGMTYFYHILPGEKPDERDIRALSWVNRFDKQEQADILNELRGEDKAKVQPAEGSILLSPGSVMKGFSSDAESFRTIWGKIGEKFMEKEDRDFIYPPTYLMEAMLLNGEEIMKKRFGELDVMMEAIAEKQADGASRNDIADQFNILLGTADQQLLYKDYGEFEDIMMKPKVRKTVVETRQPDILPPAGVLFDINRQNGNNVRTVEVPCEVSGAMMKTGGGEGSIQQTPVIGTWNFIVPGQPQERAKNKLQIRETKLPCTCPECDQKVVAEIDIINKKIKCPECKSTAPYDC